jgi:flagellar basal body-associated protein FliL
MTAEEDVPEKENLELDKLEVSLPDGTGAKPSESSDQLSGDDAHQKSPGVQQRIFGLGKYKSFALSLAVGLVVGSIAVFVVSYYVSSSHDRDLAEAPQGKITYSVSCPVGFKYHVAFKLLLPFKGNDEKRAQVEVLPRIRSELMTLGQTADVAKWLREKNIEALKAEILKTVNKVTGIPLTELELVGLAVNE